MDDPLRQEKIQRRAVRALVFLGLLSLFALTFIQRSQVANFALLALSAIYFGLGAYSLYSFLHLETTYRVLLRGWRTQQLRYHMSFETEFGLKQGRLIYFLVYPAFRLIFSLLSILVAI